MSEPHLLALGSLAAAFALGGYALERLCFRQAPLGDLRWLARVVLGVLLWMAGLFALAASGRLSSGSVQAFAAVCAVGAGLARVRLGAAPAAAAGLGFLLATALLTAPFLVLALRPEVSWDASAYHLTLPRHWLASGGFAPLPLSVYAHWPLATELLYAAAMAIQDYTVARALHYAFGLATLWALYLGARAFHRGESGWIAAPLVLANPVFLFELGVAYVDLAYAFFFSAGMLFGLQWRQSRGTSRSSLWLLGLCCGGLAGLKVTGVVGAAAIAAPALPRIARRLRGRERRSAGRDLLALGLPVACLWGAWLVKSALLTGNPVYPLFYGIFGGPDWSPALSRQLTDWLSSIGMGREPLDYALLPLRVIVSGGPGYDHFGGRIGAQWLVLVPLAIAFGRSPLARSALTVSGVYFALWSLGSQQMRFLIPLLGPLALASGVAISQGLARLPSARARRAALAAALSAAALLYLHTARLPLANAWQALREPPGDPRTDADRFVATLPADAKLLVLNTNQTFFLERAYLADSFFEASQIADWLGGESRAEDVLARLRERGVTHVLLEHSDRGIDWPAGLTALLADPGLLTRRFRSADGRFELFELR